MKARRLIFTAGPWNLKWGDCSEPRQVAGVRVAEEILGREGGGGALVVLADGRFALTGATFAAGTARALKRYARSRARYGHRSDRAWLLIVTEELRLRSWMRRLPPTEGRIRRSSASSTSRAHTEPAVLSRRQ